VRGIVDNSVRNFSPEDTEPRRMIYFFCGYPSAGTTSRAPVLRGFGFFTRPALSR